MPTPDNLEKAIQILRNLLDTHTGDIKLSRIFRQKVAWCFFHLCKPAEQTRKDVERFYFTLCPFSELDPSSENDPIIEETLQSYLREIGQTPISLADGNDGIACFYGAFLTVMAEQRWKHEPASQSKIEVDIQEKSVKTHQKDGFFFTPAPVAQFMAEVLQPEADEIVYDPAAGTGNLLVAAYRYNQALKATLQGYEIDPEVAMLGVMNMALHGIDITNFYCKNALSALEVGSPRKSEQGSLFAEDQLTKLSGAPIADVILAHLPFYAHVQAFQTDKKIPRRLEADYDLYYLQLCMDSLEEGVKSRCALILERKVLQDENREYTRIRKKLFRAFNIQLIITLPSQTFGRASDGATFLLVFTREHGTKRTLRYELPETVHGPVTGAFFEPVRKIWKQKELYLDGNEPLPEGEEYQYLWIEPYDVLHYEESLLQDPSYGSSNDPYKLLYARTLSDTPLIHPTFLVEQALERTEVQRKALLELQQLLAQGVESV